MAQSKSMLEIREAREQEYLPLGDLTVKVYANLLNMPGPEVMPDYFELLRDVAGRAATPSVKIFVALDDNQTLLGGVTYIGDMKYYGSGGTAGEVKNAAGFRLLAVNPDVRGGGVGRALTEHCINRAKQDGVDKVIIHTTQSMQVAWSMYEKIGFIRFPEIDFDQNGLAVYGFYLPVNTKVAK